MTDTKNPDIETIIKTIGKSTRIAIVLPEQSNIDLVSASIALATAIKAAEKEAEKVLMIFSAAGSQKNPVLPFLKTSLNIHPALNSSDQLEIRISNQNAKPTELRYEKDDDGLTVFITPNPGGKFKEEDIMVSPPMVKFDLVIILGASNFEQLGSVYTQNTKLFFETPHINIDTNPANEFFGTINFVQATASSVSELVMDIVEAIPEALKDEIVSTALLAGIISQTSSFRDPRTTPQAMLKASRLIEAGAKQQEIIQYLFKTKPLPLLQLWGRALARLTALPEKQTLTAVVTKSDMEKTQVGVESLPVVVRDIIEMITGYSLVILLAELPSGGVQAVIAGLPFEDLAAIMTQLKVTTSMLRTPLSGKYEYISIHLESGLVETQELLNKIIENRNSVV